LRYAIEDLSSGSSKQCILINASYRADLEPSEAEALTHLIHGFDESDSDTQRSLGRALDIFNHRCELSHWFFRGGYGRGVDFYDPFYSVHESPIIPQQLRSFTAPILPSRSSMIAWLKFISRTSIAPEFSAFTATSMIHSFPEITPLLEQFVSGDEGASQTKSGIVAALIFSDLPMTLSPVHLRCLLNQEHTGGPLIETPEMIGELIYYSQQSKTQLVARQLIQRLSESGRSLCASYLRAQIMDGDQDRELSRLLFSLGFSMPGFKTQHSNLDVRLALGQEISAQELVEALKRSEATECEFWHELILNLVDGEDRSRDLALARDERLWREISTESLQAHLLNLSKQGWIKREVACVIAASCGDSILTGPQAHLISEMIQRLCNDSDSDVKQEAQKAASVLKLKVLIINAETLRSGVTSGSPQEVSEWSERLYTFIKNEEGRNEILTLCRDGALWEALDQDELGAQWLEFSEKGWVAREAAAVIATHHHALLLCSHAEEIRDRLIKLTTDSDSDVEREARTACVTLGIE
jgi:hypothetical protein